MINSVTSFFYDLGQFLLGLGVLLLGLGVLLLVVWLVVKVAKAAWMGGNHKAKPTEATVSSAGTETIVTEAPASPSEPTSTPESDQQ
jgi:Na+-transporting methylmalonyl-CoA/oxaloacetate decarboxylase gamma subunit